MHNEAEFKYDFKQFLILLAVLHIEEPTHCQHVSPIYYWFVYYDIVP